MITKKGDGSQVKESTDSSTTIEDDDVKGMFHSNYFLCLSSFRTKNYSDSRYIYCVHFRRKYF